MLKKMLVLFCGLFGVSLIAPKLHAADVLGQDMKVEKKSFDEVSVGTQDFSPR